MACPKFAASVAASNCANRQVKILHPSKRAVLLMLKLYYALDNASLILRLALEEADVAYETVLVDRAVSQQRSPDYLAINPTGLIPSLVTRTGTMAETGACLLWLIDTYREAKLGPSQADAARGSFLRWLFYLSNTVHAELTRIFYAKRLVPFEALSVHHETMAKHVQKHFGILDRAIVAEARLFAPPSAHALYLGPLLRLAALNPAVRRRWLDLATFPALKGLALELETRPSVRAAILAEGLGDTPFSCPSYPNPREGSAL